MVWFVCDSCGDSIKKPKINGHLRQCAAQYFTCIDCSVTFDRRSVHSHTSCVSEKEKYVDVVTKPTGAKNLQNGNSTEKAEPVIVGVEFLATERPWKCSLCNIQCTGRNELESHAKGAKHGRKVRNAKPKEVADQAPAQPESGAAQVAEKASDVAIPEELNGADAEKVDAPQKKKRKSEEKGEGEQKPSKKKKGPSSNGGDREEGNSKKKRKKNDEKRKENDEKVKKEQPKTQKLQGKKASEKENGAGEEESKGNGDLKEGKKRKKTEKAQGKGLKGKDCAKATSAENGKANGIEEKQKKKRRKSVEKPSKKKQSMEALETGGRDAGELQQGKVDAEDFEGIVAVAVDALREAGGAKPVKKMKKILRERVQGKDIDGILAKLDGHSKFRRDGKEIMLADT
ncbi:hypothetical protein BSKO_06204 [Bryopsis sp. KO-2023]|nr:hypothetical protein BSKO_06204 [Bryopsis sp. KO-2023]